MHQLASVLSNLQVGVPIGESQDTSEFHKISKHCLQWNGIVKVHCEDLRASRTLEVNYSKYDSFRRIPLCLF